MLIMVQIHSLNVNKRLHRLIGIWQRLIDKFVILLHNVSKAVLPVSLCILCPIDYVITDTVPQYLPRGSWCFHLGSDFPLRVLRVRSPDSAADSVPVSAVHTMDYFFRSGLPLNVHPLSIHMPER